MSTKSTVSASTTSTTDATEKAKVVIVVPANVKTLISSSAKADNAVAVAMKASEQSSVKLAKAIREIKGEQGDIRAALKPLFIEAFKATGREEKYAGEQLSRVFTLAYPGGKNATAKQAADTVKQLDAAIEANVSINNLLPIARRSAKFDTKTQTVVPIKADNRGGKNAKKPLDSFAFAVGNAITAGKLAKLTIDQMAVKLVEAFVANGFALDDVACAVKDASVA